MTQREQRNVNEVSLLWAGPEHATEIAQLHARLFEPAWDKASVQKLLENPASTSLVAKHGFPKQSIGFVMSQIAADEAEILSIGVIEDWQRVGVGMRLLEAMDRALKRANVGKVFLEVAADNVGAAHLYSKAGYLQVGTRAGYYVRPGGAPVDALQLRKTF